MTALAIERLSAADLEEIAGLLADAGLPNDDCSHPDNRFFGIRLAEQLVACGGLQLAAGDALLRSLAVRPDHQGKGIGRLLVEHLMDDAANHGVASVYLLTETSDQYFKGLGFEVINRQQAPDALQRTEQFSALCPAAAVCLKKALHS